MHADDAIDELERRLDAEDRSVHVVAVDGHSAAGKSTFAGELVRRLGAARVPGDDFYRVIDPRVRAELSPEQGASRYYDWERMLEEVLMPLRSGRAAYYRPYDWSRNRLNDISRTIEPAKVVVVDGLFVSRPELAHVVDIALVVVAEPALRHQRQLDRSDATVDWLNRWDAAECWYFAHVRPVESFDLIVRGTADGRVEPG